MFHSQLQSLAIREAFSGATDDDDDVKCPQICLRLFTCSVQDDATELSNILKEITLGTIHLT